MASYAFVLGSRSALPDKPVLSCKERSNESLGSFHTASGSKHVACSSRDPFRNTRLSGTACERPAKRGISNHYSVRVPTRRQPSDDGRLGGNAAGAPTIVGAWDRFDAFDKHPGNNDHNHSIRTRSQY